MGLHLGSSETLSIFLSGIRYKLNLDSTISTTKIIDNITVHELDSITVAELDVSRI